MQPDLPPPQPQGQPPQPAPNQPPQTPYQAQPSDYLDSIAPPQPVKTLNPLLLWGGILGVLAIVFIMLFALLGSGGNPKEELMEYSLRVESLLDISENAQDDIQASELRSINSSLSLVLADAKQGVAAFQTEKVNKKSTAYTTVSSETEQLSGKLEDARLNAVYDRVYARELRFALASLRSQMSVIYQDTRDDGLQTYLEDTDANLKDISSQLGSFNAD